MISLGVNPSHIRWHLALSLLVNLTLYANELKYERSKNDACLDDARANNILIRTVSYVLELLILVPQWRNKEFIDKWRSILAIIKQVHRSFHLILDGLPYAIDLLLFRFGSLQEAAVTAFQLVILVSCKLAESVGRKDNGQVSEVGVADAVANILVASAVEHINDNAVRLRERF